MINEEKLKKLTWKYFWKQKKEEIVSLVGFCFPYFCFILFLVLSLLATLYRIIAIVVLTIVVGGIVFILLWLFYLWIKENWKRAGKKAKKELNGVNKK